MTAYVASKSAVLDWLRREGQETPVYFPRPKGSSSFELARVRRHSELALEDVSSPVPRREFRASGNLIPPVKQLLPPRETLFRFRIRSEAPGGFELEPVLDESDRVLAGIRPCDLKAIHLMDRVNSSGTPDPYYLTRRAHTAIVAHDCLQPCDEHCFCDAAGSLGFRDGADLFLTPLPERELLLECFTPRGESLVASAGFAPCPDPQAKKDLAETYRARPFGRQLPVPVAELPAILAAQWDSELWDKHVERCFSCGTCNLVCPTCYCFDVHDDIDLDDTANGSRSRTWDGCMFADFSAVAGGHVFRRKAADRQRHRVKRKFEYLQNGFGEGSFCVGCGRCGHQCTAGIDIFDIVSDLATAAGGKE